MDRLQRQCARLVRQSWNAYVCRGVHCTGYCRESVPAAGLRSIVLVEQDITQACEFFRQGLGARVLVATEGWAEIELNTGADIAGDKVRSDSVPDGDRTQPCTGDSDKSMNASIPDQERPGTARETRGKTTAPWTDAPVPNRKSTGKPETRPTTREHGRGASMVPVTKIQIKKRQGARMPPDRGSPSADTGHAPATLLVFDVPHVQRCIERMLQFGGKMDGRIEYSPDGTTQAVVKTPGGTSIGLVSSSG